MSSELIARSSRRSVSTGMALNLQGVSKSYGPSLVLDDVSVVARERETVGIIGENGAGKSTLLNIISGTAHADAGQMKLGGEAYAPRNYHEANLRGVFRIFQELSLVPSISVAENLFLSHERHFTRFGLLNHSAMRQRAAEVFETYEHPWIDPGASVMDYGFATRQVVEIIKALALADLLEVEAPVLLFDEPTAALVHDELVFFRRLMRRVRERATVLFVSHHVSELLELSDRIYVLKDGRAVAERPAEEFDETGIHALMVGRERSADYYRENEQQNAGTTTMLELRGVTGQGYRNVSLALRAGEVFGIAGVLGSGKSEVAGAVATGEGAASGQILVAGLPVKGATPNRMQALGVCYVPPERKEEGVILEASIAHNIALGRVGRGLGSSFFVNPGGDDTRARQLIKTLRIKCSSAAEPVSSLSGGNQQKVVLARWLATGVSVLVMDNPTRGVDAGAKEEIYQTLRELTAQGASILLISDDLLELIGLSNRIAVMRHGEITRVMDAPPHAKPSEVDLIDAMV